MRLLRESSATHSAAVIMLPRLLPLLLVVAASAADSSLCYKLKWGAGVNGLNQGVIQPIMGFPAAHPLVNGNVSCPGQNLAAGDPIPATAQAIPRAGGGCVIRSGPELFYSYNYPAPASANTGYALAERIVLFMIDVVGEIYVVLTIDAPFTPIGGQFGLDVSLTGVQADSVKIVRLDDANEYDGFWRARDADPPRVLFPPWNESLSRGSFYWAWGDGKTDGLILGPMPETGFQLTLSSQVFCLQS